MTDQDRFNFPKDIYRVTAGSGGESLLIDGGDEVGLYDCGMAYCHDGVIENIKDKLKDLGHNNLDKIFLSHSHYDHIGALPYILREWPDAVVIGGNKLKKVFSSEGAKAVMKRLGEAARDKYLPPEKHDLEITAEGMRVDQVVTDGETISLGRYDIKAIFTPGHTDCSFSYLLKERSEDGGPSVLFLSESLGVMANEKLIYTSILKSFEDTIESVGKCRAEDADILVSSHYGIVPAAIKDDYFDLFIEFACKERDFILGEYDKGLSFEEICRSYEKEYWSSSRRDNQPLEAFKENEVHTIRIMVKTFRNADIG